MGLDVSHDCYHGGYGSFNRWRDEVAVLAGYKIITHKDDRIEVPDIGWDDIPDSALHGEWPHPPKDALLYLIAHSDCDGYLPWKCLKPLADRLQELLPLMTAKEGQAPLPGSMMSRTETFIKGLRLAHKRREKVTFK